MENATAMKATPMEPPKPTIENQIKQDHWFIQVVGGVTLANTMVSALAFLWLFMEFGLTA